MGMKRLLFALAPIILVSPLTAKSADRHAYSAGLHYTGAQLCWAFSPRWAVEGRYSVGEETLEDERIGVQVFSAGLTRSLSVYDDWGLYSGARAGWILTRDRDGGSPRGYAAGAVVGVERFVGRRVSLSLDIGPYLFRLKNPSGSSDTSFDVVADAAVYIHWGGVP